MASRVENLNEENPEAVANEGQGYWFQVDRMRSVETTMDAGDAGKVKNDRWRGSEPGRSGHSEGEHENCANLASIITVCLSI